MTLSQELEPKLKTVSDQTKAVSIVNIKDKVKIPEVTAEGNTDIVEVADMETKLVEEGEAQEVNECNATEPDSEVKPIEFTQAEVNPPRS